MLFGQRVSRLQSNCIVSVEMGDGEGWPLEMEYS